jgi:hypothetical protein
MRTSRVCLLAYHAQTEHQLKLERQLTVRHQLMHAQLVLLERFCHLKLAFCVLLDSTKMIQAVYNVLHVLKASTVTRLVVLNALRAPKVTLLHKRTHLLVKYAILESTAVRLEEILVASPAREESILEQ